MVWVIKHTPQACILLAVLCLIHLSPSSVVVSSLLQPVPVLLGGYRARGCNRGEQQALSCGTLTAVGQVSLDVSCVKDLKVIQGLD